MKIYFEPVNVNQWNLFEKVGGVGHIEPFLATKSMKMGDCVLLHVGAQNKQYESGIYAYGTIVREPYILENSPEDYCNGKNTVDVRIDCINFDEPIISHHDATAFISQFRTVHCISEQHYDEISQLIHKEQNELTISRLSILKTDEDMHGSEISEMSDFMGEYIGHLSTEVCRKGSLVPVVDFPMADIGIFNDAIQAVETKMTGGTMLVSDLEHLPKEIKEKLKTGKYRIAESRQVDGNLRAVIIDQDNVRVRDITLKKVKEKSVNPEITRSLAEQLQLRQIYLKLDSMERTQNYQLNLTKNWEIVRPFLDARDNIMLAQVTDNEDDQKKYLEKAFDQLTTSKNAAFLDINESVKVLKDETKNPFIRPFFGKRNTIDEYTRFITSDLNVANKIVGLQLQILDYEGKHAEAELVKDGYRNFLQNFCNKPLGKGKPSAGMLLHNNYPYTEDNLNAWYEMIEGVKESSDIKVIPNATYVITVDDDSEDNNGENNDM